MKAEELRIGNYILGIFEDENDDGETIEVTEICEVVALDSVDLTEYRIWVEPEKSQREHWDNIIGIPLTEQWLSDLGLSGRLGEVSDTYHIGINPVTRDWLLDIIWIHGTDYPFYRNGHFTIKYVHQLQNLFFALTGKELRMDIHAKNNT